MQNFFISRIDYIFFVYGLVFLFFSAGCFILQNQSKIFAWYLLGLFGLVNGLNQWLYLWVVSFHQIFYFKFVHLFILAISFIFIIKFGRLTSLKIKSLQHAEADLRESTAQMMNAEKFTALGEMASGIAHELNQPLNVTKIICQGILNDIRKNRFSQEDLEKDLPEVVVQMDKMAEIIEHMRAFTAIRDGTEKKEFDINLVVENSFKFTGAQMVSHGVELKKELANTLPLLTGDSVSIEQAILNVLNNARNAVEGSGKPEKNITVKTYLTENNKNVCVQISDNGLGIPVDIREKIFQPFFTTKNALAPDGRPVKGKGLGLSVAQKTVKDHGGQIVLVSEVGVGSTFNIILPV